MTAGDRRAFGLEPELPIGLVLCRPCRLQIVQLVPVPDQLDLPPYGEHQDGDEEHPHRDRPPHLTMPLAIDLSDDWVVAHILLDGVLE